MGKNKFYRIIREQAAKLPVIPETQVLTSHYMGSELIEQGVTKIKDADVDPKKSYSGTRTVAKPVNHYKKMKDIFDKHRSMEKLQEYMTEVYIQAQAFHARQMQIQQENQKIDQVGALAD